MLLPTNVRRVGALATSASSKGKIHLFCLLILSALALAPAEAVERQLAICPQGGPEFASAEYQGNEKKGRTKLTSSGPTASAGFNLTGVEGLTVNQLQDIRILLGPNNKGRFYLRVGVKPNEVEEFTIGPSVDKGPPNIKLDDSGGTLKWANIDSKDLTGGKSELRPKDVITKVSFYFQGNSRRDGLQVMVVDDVLYDNKAVPLNLNVGGCNLLF